MPAHRHRPQADSKLVVGGGTAEIRRAGIAARLAHIAAAAKPAAVSDQAMLDAVNGEWRPAEDKPRDRYRHPKETLEFFDRKQQVPRRSVRLKQPTPNQAPDRFRRDA